MRFLLKLQEIIDDTFAFQQKIKKTMQPENLQIISLQQLFRIVNENRPKYKNMVVT